MTSERVLSYTHPAQFEPLLPQREMSALAERTRAVVEKAYRLQHSVSPSAAGELRELVRGMNAYYSNRIERQETHPSNIVRALKADFSTKPETARRQRVAVAHIEAERELEQMLTDARAHMGAGQSPEGLALQTQFLVNAHRALYARLPEQDRTTEDGRVIEPGVLRTLEVAVGRHQPPVAASVKDFLVRMDQVYPRISGCDTLLVTIASAHHRASWVHPFGDGNGRACRLQTHCAMHSLTAGLWSVNRGMARQREKYYEMLDFADSPRAGDLDGRGNLSEKALRGWCEYFIELAYDQVSFMSSLLSLDKLKQGIDLLMLVRSESKQYEHYSRKATLALHHVLLAGPVSRVDFMAMTGLAERTASRVLGQLLKDGLLVSPTPKGAVSFGFPLDALSLLLPNLYPEAAALNTDA